MSFSGRPYVRPGAGAETGAQLEELKQRVDAHGVALNGDGEGDEGVLAKVDAIDQDINAAETGLKAVVEGIKTDLKEDGAVGSKIKEHDDALNDEETGILKRLDDAESSIGSLSDAIGGEGGLDERLTDVESGLGSLSEAIGGEGKLADRIGAVENSISGDGGIHERLGSVESGLGSLGETVSGEGGFSDRLTGVETGLGSLSEAVSGEGGLNERVSAVEDSISGEGGISERLEGIEQYTQDATTERSAYDLLVGTTIVDPDLPISNYGVTSPNISPTIWLSVTNVGIVGWSSTPASTLSPTDTLREALVKLREHFHRVEDVARYLKDIRVNSEGYVELEVSKDVTGLSLFTPTSLRDALGLNPPTRVNGTGTVTVSGFVSSEHVVHEGRTVREALHEAEHLSANIYNLQRGTDNRLSRLERFYESDRDATGPFIRTRPLNESRTLASYGIADGDKLKIVVEYVDGGLPDELELEFLSTDSTPVELGFLGWPDGIFTQLSAFDGYVLDAFRDYQGRFHCILSPEYGGRKIVSVSVEDVVGTPAATLGFEVLPGAPHLPETLVSTENVCHGYDPELRGYMYNERKLSDIIEELRTAAHNIEVEETPTTFIYKILGTKQLELTDSFVGDIEISVDIWDGDMAGNSLVDYVVVEPEEEEDPPTTVADAIVEIKTMEFVRDAYLDEDGYLVIEIEIDPVAYGLPDRYAIELGYVSDWDWGNGPDALGLYQPGFVHEKLPVPTTYVRSENLRHGEDTLYEIIEDYKSRIEQLESAVEALLNSSWE